MKDVGSQGGGGFVQCGHFSDKGGRKGSSEARVRTFWLKKYRIF